ncbi:putative reverse transcriptase domain-containing protein [Tanacetum coccineum]
MPIELGTFDVIIGMDLLVDNDAVIAPVPAIIEDSSRDFLLSPVPLTKLTQKNKRFEWGADEDEAFQKLKQDLCTAPILALPEGPDDFVVYCDASLKGYGAVTMQRI